LHLWKIKADVFALIGHLSHKTQKEKGMKGRFVFQAGEKKKNRDP